MQEDTGNKPILDQKMPEREYSGKDQLFAKLLT
jgi:hypothetical protein